MESGKCGSAVFSDISQSFQISWSELLPPIEPSLEIESMKRIPLKTLEYYAWNWHAIYIYIINIY